jgi:subtilisin family serine protease
MAPSGPIISAENSFYNDFNDDLEALKISKGDGTNWSYSYRTGTSVAAPVITGIVALMLQADPSLTPEMTKEILMDNSRMDEFTGTTPNNLWGYGKVDAYNAMKSLEQVTNVINTENSLDIDIYPNPNHGHFWIKTKGEKLGSITILDASGRRLYQERIETHSKQINLNSLSLTTGVYFIETIQGKKMQVNKLIILN